MAAPVEHPVELVLYHVNDNGITKLGALHGCLPELQTATLQAVVNTNPSLQDGMFGVGLYMAISENDGEILDVARLYPLCKKEEGKVDGLEEEEIEDEDEEVDGLEEEEESSDGEEDSSEEKEEVDGLEEESSDGEEDSSEEKEEAEWSEKKDAVVEKISMHIRLYVDSSNATLIIFDKDRWRLTKTYSIKWLRSDEERLMLKLLDKENNQQITSHGLKGYVSKLDFKGPLIYSNYLEDTITEEMSLAINDFTVTKELGKGATSKVYQCFLQKSSMLQYAIKIIKVKSKYDLDAYNGTEPREIQIMSCCSDSSALKFYQAWPAAGSRLCLDEEWSCSSDDDYFSEDGSSESDDSNFDVYILMEICFRNMRAIVGIGEHCIDVEEGWVTFEKIAKAVNSIHQKGVIHRDLKPDNIFVGDNGEIKLGDFGDSCWENSYTNGRDGTPNRGTQLYMAPELKTGKVSKKVDIYSLGIIFLEIFYPFKTGTQRYHVLMDVKEGKYPTDWVGDTILLKKLTALSPIERASTNDILDYVGSRNTGGGPAN